MSTKTGIVIFANGSKTMFNDMEKLNNMLEKKVLPLSEKHLQAEFKSKVIDNIHDSLNECDHKFGMLDENGTYTDLNKIDAAPSIRCCKCNESFFLFTDMEIQCMKENEAKKIQYEFQDEF